MRVSYKTRFDQSKNMKATFTKLFLSVSTILISLISAANAEESVDQKINSSHRNVANIDATDTVVFDLSQAIVMISTVEFPLYFFSDDTVNAVDFSLKFNQTNFEFDSVINLTPNLQTMSYLNVSDSTLRFTSNCLQRIPNDSALINIRFNVISGSFCVSDLSDILVYLNGDLCSSKVIDCVSNNISEFDASNLIAEVYPNPALQNLTIHANEDLKIVVSNLIGETLLPEFELLHDQINTIDVSNFAPGIYILRMQANGHLVSKKIVVAD